MTGHNDAAGRAADLAKVYAGAIEYFLQQWPREEIAAVMRGGNAEVALIKTALRIVLDDRTRLLGELAEARQQNDGLKTERGIQFHETETGHWHTSEFATLADAIETEGGRLQWREASRLVGEWTEAEDTSSKEQT